MQVLNSHVVVNFFSLQYNENIAWTRGETLSSIQATFFIAIIHS